MRRTITHLFDNTYTFFIASPVFAWQLLFFYIPLTFIVVLSLAAFSDAGIFQGLTIQFFIPLFSPLYAWIIIRSLGLALFTSAMCLMIGYPVAYYLALKSERLKNVLLLLLIIPFWTNFLLHVFAWMFILERNGIVNILLQKLGLIVEPLALLNNMFAVMLMMVYSYLPFMILPIYASLERFDKQLSEASLDLGANWLQTLYRIIVPLSLPGIIGGFFLVFVPAFGEFAIPELMGGDKVMFAGSVISHYIVDAQTKGVGAAFTIVSACALLCASLVILGLLQRIIGGKYAHIARDE
jgi:spermidine/putrescine transport system permease protein